MDGETRTLIRIVMAVVAAVALLVVGACSVVPSVEPGKVGVVKSFGNMDDRPFEAGGPYLVRPWASVVRMNVQTVKNDEEATVPTKGGLPVKLHAILLYRLEPAKAANVLRTVGEKYEETVIDPVFRNVVRDVCATHTPEDLYTDARTEVESQILAKTSKELEARGFVCEAVMIQDPRLPDVVADRIQAKIAAEQDAIRMQSVYKQREQEAMASKRQKELESEAKVIEAKGIADAQKIIQQDITENYLKYLHIQALTEAAKHNTTIIYVPVGPDGLPVVGQVREKK